MSTPTPRTDAATALTSQHRYDYGFGDPEFGWVTAGFARTLERELAAEREKVKTLREACERIAAFSEVFAGDIGSRSPAQRNAKVAWLLVHHVIAAETALAATEEKQ